MTIARIIRNLSTRSPAIITRTLSDALAVGDSATATYVPEGGDANTDWLARSTAPGVLAAYELSDTSDFVTASSSSGGRGKWGADGGLGQAGNEALVVRDTSDFISGSACLRLEVPAGGNSGGALICTLNPTWTTKAQGIGSTEFYVQIRSKIPSSRLTVQPGSVDGHSGGPKIMNFAGYDPADPRNGSRSNIECEHVLQHTNWYGIPQTYRRTSFGGPFSGAYAAFGEIPFGGSFIMQNAIPDPFCLLNAQGPCFDWYPDEWVTYLFRFRIQTYDGSTGNLFDMWGARQGASTYTHIYTAEDYDVGAASDGFSGGLNGIWLTAFDTGFEAPGTVTYQKYAQIIVSTQLPAVPNDLPAIGSSTLEQAAAALSANQAAQVVAVSGMNPISSVPGASIMEYVGRAGWSPDLRKIIFSGVQHTNGFAQYGEYNVAANDWVNEELIPDGRTDPRHAYCGTDCAADGTHIYHEGNSGADTLWKRTPAGVWTSYDTVLPNYGHVAYHPERDDFIIGKVWGIQSFNYQTNAFTTLLNRPGGDCMADGGGAATYNRKDSHVYVGKTGGANAAMWKVSAAGTCTQVTPPAAGLGIWDASNNVCQLYGAANSANKLLAISRDGEPYEYDEGADSWSSELSSAVFPAALKTWIQGAANAQWFAVPIADFGVIAFFRESPTSEMDETFYIWKH